MSLNKGHSKALNQRIFLYGFLLLISGLIHPGVTECRANVCPDNLIAGIYPVDIFKADFPDFKNFSVKRDLPVAPLTKKQANNHNKSPQPSDQCYFYEGHRSFADKGPEPALPAFSGIFLGYPIYKVSYIPCLPFVIFSSWTGNTIKIRPPPV
jgi:hypothetical protein